MARPRVRLMGQAIPLWAGVIPLLMIMGFAFRSGAGLHSGVALLGLVAFVGFLASVGYHFFYRAGIPRVVIKPMGIGGAIAASAVVLPLCLVNLWGSDAGYSLAMSPNPMQEPLRWLQVAAKLLLGSPVGEGMPPIEPPALSAWVYQGVFLGGALWGALGYAAIAGIASAIFAAFRKEVFDPRQEPFSGGFWPVSRILIGFYYGFSLGFMLGAALEFSGTMLFGRAEIPASIAGFLSGIGLDRDPNRAFSHAFSAGGGMICLAALFLGKADFAVGFSDPKPEEREPDMKVSIPDLPKSAPPQFDFSSILAESEQINASFQQELKALVRQLGLSDVVESAASVLADKKPEEDKAEPEVVNVISARKPDFDVSFDSAMGQLSNVYVQVSALLGATEMPLTEWLTLEENSIIEFPRAPDNSMTVCINGKPVGRGKPVTLEGRKAIKVLKLSAEAVSSLREGR